MTRLLRLLPILFTLLPLATALGEPPQPILLVKNHQPVARIVTPAQPSPAQRFAAEELQIYLRKMSGAELQIVRGDELPAGAALVIGPHPAGKKITEALAAAHRGNREAFAVVSDGQHLHLAGASETAICYAAWDWLESLGVRWVMPTERGEFVPKMDTITAAPIEKLDAPALWFRGGNYWMLTERSHPESSTVTEHGLPASVLFSLRMRLNCNIGFDRADRVPQIGSGHSYTYYLNPKRYYKDHPEWFNLIGGKRRSDEPWQVCFTNRAAAAEFAKNLMADVQAGLAAGVPIERMQLWVSPNDNKAWCECGECQKLVDSDGSATSMVANFANLVAGFVRERYPRASVVFYAYDNYARPPEHVKLDPGVHPELVFWTADIAVGANNAHPMFSDRNPRFRDYFAQYAQMSTALSAHEYYGHYTWFTPWPKITQMANDLPAMAREPKFYGMYSESHLHWGTQGPNLYLHPRLMWNPKLNANAVLKDYYQAAYGPAAPFVERYFRTLQQQMDGLDYVNGYVTEIPLLLTPQVIRQCNLYLKQAAATMGTMDPMMRWRTQLLISAWENSAKFAEASRLFITSNSPADRQRILELTDAVETFAASEEGRWAFEYKVAHSSLQKVRRALAVPLENLPLGATEYSDSFSQGGAIKFFADIQGFTAGMWGYSLPTAAAGRIELPLTCADGGTIAALSIRLQTASFKDLDLKVMFLDPSGTWRPSEPKGNLFPAPAEVLNQKRATIGIIASSRFPKPQVVLTGAEISISVAGVPEVGSARAIGTGGGEGESTR